ncbi:hypothetical protein TUBRATIS_25920 [Tubulinosema ratisbonensis]|uniref:Uncharacterized protein n=1 Tax=Tubulinosema ratisbonensis TaxID=291195 RepID=A0A437AIJ2_9MICR|nr:hypothetical protein TUBRATIS_25920 [Tubulinosema ratisbonensis]
MSDNKTEAVKQKLEETDQKVKGTIKDVENSKFGKSIPMEIRGLTLYDIIKFLTLFLLYSDLAIYLQIQAKGSAAGKITSTYSTVIKFVFYFAGVVGDIFVFASLLLNIKTVFKFIVVIKVVKMVIVLLIMFSISSIAIVSLLPAMIFGLLSCFFDIIHVYYTALFFERAESEDYDQYGTPIKKDVIEIKENQQQNQQEPPTQKV